MESGNSVIIIEHNLDVVANAYRVINLGQEGGGLDDEIIFKGTPAQPLEAQDSLISEYLRRQVGSRA